MCPENQGVYIIPGDGDQGEEGWVAPEPAETVIVEEVLAATDLSADTVEPLEDESAGIVGAVETIRLLSEPSRDSPR
jgi:hypothetical protein